MSLPCPDYIKCGVNGYKNFLLESVQKDAISSFGYISNDLNSICADYIKLGFHLDEGKRNKIHEVFGYVSFDEFVQANFHLDRSALSRCLNVFYAFSSKSSSGVNQMIIDDKYAKYIYSQLCEMVSLTPHDRNFVTSDMTVNQIRDYKKSIRKNVPHTTPFIFHDASAPNPAADPGPDPVPAAAAGVSTSVEVDFNDVHEDMDESANVDLDPCKPEEIEYSIPDNESFSVTKFNSLGGVSRINYFKKAVPMFSHVSFAFYSKSGKRLSQSELIEYINDCLKLKCRLIEIHPFTDGNGRTMRALVNLLFKIAGLPPVYVKRMERGKYLAAMGKAITDNDFSAIN